MNYATDKPWEKSPVRCKHPLESDIRFKGDNSQSKSLEKSKSGENFWFEIEA
jgi:hypothetical protein